jgi:SAM-dependent methyltransferase
MTDLLEVVHRAEIPEPWAEGEKIPWNDPEFSRRMLAEHLSQEHDWASRRAATIDMHVDWIHRSVLSEVPSRVLDLGCGPGLYAARLAALGHTCTGIDFSPASISYAGEQASKSRLACTYVLEDVRLADFGTDNALVMFIFGESNVFTRDDFEKILRKAHAALSPGGHLLLEVHTFETVREVGSSPASWYSSPSGLFSERPHLYLQENFWDRDRAVATQRYFVVDAHTGQVTRYASSMQAYSPEEYLTLLHGCGFRQVRFFPSLMGDSGPSQLGLFVILSEK